MMVELTKDERCLIHSLSLENYTSYKNVLTEVNDYI